MLHTNNPIIKHKAGLLNLAEELGNVSEACKVSKPLDKQGYFGVVCMSLSLSSDSCKTLRPKKHVSLAGAVQEK